MKQLTALFVTIFTAAFFLTPSNVSAASPDGMGPWADHVVSFSQGNTKNGTPVSIANPARSNPQSALGIAEGDTIDSHFFSLGFDGSITLRFDNGISSGVFVIEATNPDYPAETATVDLSSDGVTWFSAGSVNQDGTVNMPSEVECAAYVRITDTSNPDDFVEDNADAYDVDGVRAEGEICQVSPSSGCTCNIVQTNNSTVTNNISTNAQTGSNSASGNTGGSITVTSGNALANTTITNTGNINSATGCCCCNSNVSIAISGNGSNSTNTVRFSSRTRRLQRPSRHRR